jgi:anti-sigma regulatory factor (Ser/Thr protein kinase)
VVRHALAGLADSQGMDPAAIGDLKTVVTEACMNVVEHAYEDSNGPLEVAAEVEEDGILEIVVRDRGAGIRPRAESERPSLRIGLALIASLTETVEIRHGSEGGTEIRMRMSLSRREPAAVNDVEAPDVADETVISVPAGDLVAPVLTRVVSMLATRADFSVDRLSDTMLISDAISAHSSGNFTDGVARIVVTEREGTVAVRVGPLVKGGAERLLELMRIPELDLSLESLADEIRVDANGTAEQLHVALGKR